MKKFFGAIALVLATSAFAFDAECDVRFSPNGKSVDAIVEHIDAAKTRVDVFAYSFTNKLIAESLARAVQRGVVVTAIIDAKEITKKGNRVAFVKAAGVDTYLDAKHHIQHNKVITIDDTYVHNGSFNFSFNAETANAENSMWCKSPEGVKIFRENFELHKSHAKPVVLPPVVQ